MSETVFIKIVVAVVKLLPWPSSVIKVLKQIGLFFKVTGMLLMAPVQNRGPLEHI